MNIKIPKVAFSVETSINLPYMIIFNCPQCGEEEVILYTSADKCKCGFGLFDINKMEDKEDE